ACMFRERVVSSRSGFDVACDDPAEGGFDALGKGVEEGRPSPDTRYVSKGLTRSRTDRLQVMPSNAELSSPPPGGGESPAGGGRGGVTNITALSSSAARAEISGA